MILSIIDLGKNILYFVYLISLFFFQININKSYIIINVNSQTIHITYNILI